MTDKAIRQHGKRGAILHHGVVADPTVAAAIPAVDPTALPSTFDATKGRGTYPMLGNDEFGNCGEVSLAVALMNQATLSVDDKQEPIYVAGFTEPDQATVVEWYHDIAAAEGQPFTTGEGPGTSLYTLAKYALQKGLALAVGVLGPVAPEVIAQAIYDTKGGAIVTWALDDDCFQEFGAHECWGTMSVKPDAQEGHATDGLGWAPGFAPIVDTWTRPQCTTEAFTTNCQDGLMLVFTQAWVEQGGDLDAMVAKWGLTTAASGSIVTESEGFVQHIEDDVKSFIDEGEAEARRLEKDLHRVLGMAIERVGTNVVATELQRLVTEYLHV